MSLLALDPYRVSMFSGVKFVASAHQPRLLVASIWNDMRPVTHVTFPCSMDKPSRHVPEAWVSASKECKSGCGLHVLEPAPLAFRTWNVVCFDYYKQDIISPLVPSIGT